MNKHIELIKLQGEIKTKELRYFALDAKSDRSADESKEFETLDQQIRESREKEIPAIKAATDEAEAAVIERTSNTSENRERRQLRSKVSMGRFIAQRLGGRDAWDGAEGEYVAACGVRSNEIPTEYFAKEVRRESRAVTPAPTLTGQTAQAVSSVQPTVEYAFNPQAAASLGVELRPVAPGEGHFVTVTTAPPAEPKAKSAALPKTAGALTLTTRKPVRIGGQIEVQIEDEAIFPSLTDDLDRALASSLSDKLDDQILTANGTAPNLDSIVNQATNVGVASAVETFQSGVSRYGALVDGVHATDWADIRALIGVDTFSLYSSLLTTGTDVSLFDYLKSRLGSLLVSKRVPATASNGQKGIVSLMGKMEPIVIPLWASMSMRIDDDVTQISKGIRIVTLHLLTSSPFVPYGVDQVKEVHPKVS